MKKLQRIPTGRVIADFFMGDYRFSANVPVHKQRLIDILDDSTTDFMDLVDIYVSRINKPGDIIATYQRGSLSKKEISFIFLSSETESISQQRFYTKDRASLPIFMTVPSFEIHGKIMWLGGFGSFNFKKLLNLEAQTFLPIMEATVYNSLFPAITFQGPTILVNKAKIAVTCIDDTV